MARKRKRTGIPSADPGPIPKRRKKDATSTQASRVNHPVLSLYYENVMSLREYILARFPNSSRSRKERLKAVPSWNEQQQYEEDVKQAPFQTELSKLLDTTIVAFHDTKSRDSISSVATRDTRVSVQNILQLSQALRSTIKSTAGEQGPSQVEIVEFAVEHLLNKVYCATRLPPHVLCNGFVRTPVEQSHCQLWANGLYCTFPNCNAVVLQGPSWCSLLKLLGKDGDQVMMDLLLHCCIFNPMASGKNNLCQLSGIQLSEIPLLKQGDSAAEQVTQPASRLAPTNLGKSIHNKLSDIKIVRSRMFYARAGLNAKGTVRMGLQHIHVFNRCPNYKDPYQIVHVMKYIFPRQFGLHNVFTCRPNRRETVQSQQDYTMREQEIKTMLRRKLIRQAVDDLPRMRLPRRLRGRIVTLVGRVLKRHGGCAYIELLRHYCSNKQFDPPKANRHVEANVQTESNRSPAEDDIVSLATHPSNVFAFCRSVLLKLLPKDLLDSGDAKAPNMQLLLWLAREFITARKRETLNIHAICQNFKTSSISWLMPPKSSSKNRMAKSDYLKRIELLQELLYYIFDSILIPLIRSNFYVTESNTHGNRLFYFRHDVWRQLTEPCLGNLREAMFEEVKHGRTSKHIGATDPYGHMRLVPKGATFRPIMNLKRKPIICVNGKMMLGSVSVNMTLKPVYGMLKHERLRQPALLGSSMFSMDEVYPRLKAFSQQLADTNQDKLPLYFAKVDVANCFDTIPQEKILGLMERTCSQPGYCSVRHAEVSAKRIQPQPEFTVARKFRDREAARGPQDYQAFQDFITVNNGKQKVNTVFVEQSVPSMKDRDKLMKMLADHLSHNKVKMGKKYFHQKRGIPQGSVLSSMLCNFFYGQFEAEYLDFLDQRDSLLLRLLDDFLLITLDKGKACQFLNIMHRGSPEYGITVKLQKSMVNFEYDINGHVITRCNGNSFPYCGKTINTTTLEIGKDRHRQIVSRISDSLTVDKGKLPGETFYRLALDAMKRQLHAQYTDATFNSRQQIVQTLYQDFLISALRMHAYNQGLGHSKCPVPALIVRTIQDLMRMTFSILNSTSRLKQDVGYECRVTETDIHWLAAKAFKHVLQSKQSWYRLVIAWLDDQLGACRSRNAKSIKKLNATIVNSQMELD